MLGDPVRNEQRLRLEEFKRDLLREQDVAKR
jgi:hypothetical protein